MSMHKKPLTVLEEAGLKAHHLPIGTPSQLSDSFRIGMAWAEQNSENKPLVERVQQFDNHITTVANYLGAVCGGVDVGTNIPGSTAFEIIKKIKGIETQRDSILLKTEKMLESLDAINKIIFGETIVLGSPEYFKIRQLATENHSLQEYVAKRINDLESKSRERDMLAQAIKDAAVRVGIINADTELSGTHLLMLCEDLSK